MSITADRKEAEAVTEEKIDAARRNKVSTDKEVRREERRERNADYRRRRARNRYRGL